MSTRGSVEVLNLNLRNVSLPDVGSGKWLNLETSKQLGNLKGKYALKNPPVTATQWEIIDQFLELNRIPLSKVEYLFPNDSKMLEMASETRKKKSGSMAIRNSNDLSTLTEDEISHLEEFSFSRLSVPGRVVEVIDGDTIVAVVSISLSQLVSGNLMRSDSMVCYKSLGQLVCINPTKESESFSNLKMLVKIRLRLYGIDAAEKDTFAGKRCKEWVTLKYQELKNLIWVTLLGTDARGRTLANLYETPTSIRTINSLILNHIDPYCGRVCVSYFGETKDSKFTTETKSFKPPSGELKPVCLSVDECLRGK